MLFSTLIEFLLNTYIQDEPPKNLSWNIFHTISYIEKCLRWKLSDFKKEYFDAISFSVGGHVNVMLR